MLPRPLRGFLGLENSTSRATKRPPSDPPARLRPMATITKKELIDRIADGTGGRRVQVKKVVQQFLDEIIGELGKGNRLEFRDFGVFETKIRKARKAQNPKTLEPVEVPEKRTVKFKVGRLMKQKLADMTGVAIDDEAGDVAEMNDAHDEDDGDDESSGGNGMH